MRRVVPAVGLALFLIVPAFPQTGRGAGRVRGNGTTAQAASQKQSDQLPMPTFDGTVRAIDSKLLTIERPDSNALDFNCTHKTKYFSGTKKIKASDIRAGDHVSVETTRALDGSLDAVNVRVDKPAKPAKSS